MNLRDHVLAGQVIPAHPLALDRDGRFSERHQRALTRYYIDAGVGGIAVGVHSTQFEIRDPKHGLLRPVLELASETINESLSASPRPFVKIAGICGPTGIATREAEQACDLGYHAGLLSLAALRNATEDLLIAHSRAVAESIPIIGFYLQPAVGGMALSYSFWRNFVEIPNLVAIKIAPFNRYQTIDVIRAIADSGRTNVALYTGNDDTIVADLITPYTFKADAARAPRRIVGGLLGHWGVWTRSAVLLFEMLKKSAAAAAVPAELLKLGISVTDMNAAVFDPSNGFHGCIPGILEVLRRQGLVPSRRCLNPAEDLSRGQAEELDRVCDDYPHLIDDGFVAENLTRWLS